MDSSCLFDRLPSELVELCLLSTRRFPQIKWRLRVLSLVCKRWRRIVLSSFTSISDEWTEKLLCYDALHMFSSLSILNICTSMAGFKRVRLPLSLKTLIVSDLPGHNCEIVQHYVGHPSLTALNLTVFEIVKVYACDCIAQQLTRLQPSLVALTITAFEPLRTSFYKELTAYTLTSLQSLSLRIVSINPVPVFSRLVSRYESQLTSLQVSVSAFPYARLFCQELFAGRHFPALERLELRNDGAANNPQFFLTHAPRLTQIETFDLPPDALTGDFKRAVGSRLVGLTCPTLDLRPQLRLAEFACDCPHLVNLQPFPYRDLPLLATASCRLRLTSLCVLNRSRSDSPLPLAVLNAFPNLRALAFKVLSPASAAGLYLPSLTAVPHCDFEFNDVASAAAFCLQFLEACPRLNCLQLHLPRFSTSECEIVATMLAKFEQAGVARVALNCERVPMKEFKPAISQLAFLDVIFNRDLYVEEFNL